MKKRKLCRVGLSLLDLIILLSLTFAFEYFWLDFKHFDIHIPLMYEGDGLTTLSSIVTFLRAGPFQSAQLLGAPNDAISGSSLASGTNNVEILGKLFWSLFTDDPAAILNLRVISIPFLNVLMAFYVLRALKLNRLVSYAGAFAYGTCFFVRSRMGHIGLMFCGVVPLAILICIWCFEDDHLLRLKTLFTYKRNWLMVLFSLLIANSGISYYAFFSCFFLGVTALYQLVNKRHWKRLPNTIMAIGLICFFFLLNYLPSVINRLMGVGGGSSAVMLRSFAESEIYGMRISALFLSPRGFGIPILQRAYTVYLANSYLINENTSGYLGVFAIPGCLILLLQFFVERDKRDLARHSYLPLLSRLLVSAILLATIAGFSNLFALLITDLIRGYNRITIFLTFICILTVCAIAHTLMENRSKLIRYGAAAAVILVSLFSWYDLGFDKAADQAQIADAYRSDQAFIQEIDDVLEDGAMIFQLPYATSPEQGYILRMPDYAHTVGYVHSDNLRWSYGNGRGSFRDEWYKATAARPLPDMLRQLCFADFSGLYIDTRGYMPAEVESMTAELATLLQAEPITDARGLFLFYSLEDMKAEYTSSLSPEALEQARRYALQGDSFFQYHNGFYPVEVTADGSFSWMKNKATLSYYNMSGLTEYDLTLRLASGVREGDLTVSCNDMQTTLHLTTQPETFVVSLPLIEGENTVTLTYQGLQVVAPTDPRALFYRLFDFESLNQLASYTELIEALIN